MIKSILKKIKLNLKKNNIKTIMKLKKDEHKSRSVVFSVIVLFVLRFTTSDYPYVIFKLFHFYFMPYRIHDISGGLSATFERGFLWFSFGETVI